MTYLCIILAILAINYTAVYFLRRKRNRINLTTPTGKLKVKQYNQIIDILTGYWIWNFSPRRK